MGGNEKQELWTGRWGTKACTPPARASITRPICPAAQESLRALKKNSFLTERCGNVIENKARLWKTPQESGNVVENKDSYASKAGMLLKIKVVGTR
jgi:hypothetical protein